MRKYKDFFFSSSIDFFPIEETLHIGYGAGPCVPYL